MVEIRQQNRMFPLSEHSGDEPEGSRPLPRFERPIIFGKLGGNAESSVPDILGPGTFLITHLYIHQGGNDNA